MRFLEKNYRLFSIWLSLLILTLAFVTGSDRPVRAVCVTAAFFAGTLLYLLGGIREWMRNRVTAALIEMLLAVCMLTGGLLSLLRLGGSL